MGRKKKNKNITNSNLKSIMNCDTYDILLNMVKIGFLNNIKGHFTSEKDAFVYKAIVKTLKSDILIKEFKLSIPKLNGETYFIYRSHLAHSSSKENYKNIQKKMIKECAEIEFRKLMRIR